MIETFSHQKVPCKHKVLFSHEKDYYWASCSFGASLIWGTMQWWFLKLLLHNKLNEHVKGLVTLSCLLGFVPYTFTSPLLTEWVSDLTIHQQCQWLLAWDGASRDHECWEISARMAYLNSNVCSTEKKREIPTLLSAQTLKGKVSSL